VPVAGRMASFALDVDIGERTNWRNRGVGSVPIVGIRFR